MNDRNRPRKPPSYNYFIVSTWFPFCPGKQMEKLLTDYPTDLSAHAVMLKEFFSALFDPRDTVYIYPRLRPDSPLTARSGLNPDDLPTEGRVVSRRPSSTTTKTLARLHELNAQGYDIYYCVNPLIHPRRCQKGVLMARNILIEMDHSSMDIQLEMLERFKSNIVSATYSGSRSLHMIVKLDPPLWNPYRVGRMMVPRLMKGETSARWPQFVDLANRWISRFGMLGQTIDNRAAKDYARLSRVPGFLHAGTGIVSTLEHLDRYMSWDWKNEVEDEINQICEPSDEELEDRHQMLEAGLSEYDRDRICGRDVLFPEVVPQSSIPKPRGGSNSQKEGVKPVSGAEGKALEPSPSLGGTRGFDRLVCDTSTTNVMYTRPPKSFLDDIEDYERLIHTGLPGRGTRMKYHKVVFTVARIFNWTEERLATEWRHIIEINPEGTDKTPDVAAASLLGDWRANKRHTLYLPDVTKLPEFDQGKMGLLKSRLGSMGCNEPRKAARIIAGVILPLIQKIPRQCINGTTGIKSIKLQEAANIRGESRGYRQTWEWMQKVGIVACTNKKYMPGSQIRTYWVNIPVVIWLCNYRTEELVWSAVTRNIWPELSRMRVVNDGAGDCWSEIPEMHSAGWVFA